MDDSAVFQSMLDKAIKTEPLGFTGFDRTKNVQDQLQEILGVKLPANALCAISKWVEKEGWLEFQKTDAGLLASSCPYSMEQLWLAFVMKECYNKEWLSEKNEWVSLSELPARNAKGNEL